MSTKKPKSPQLLKPMDLEEAIFAARALVCGGAADETLKRLLYLTDSDSETLEFQGKPPVTSAELHEAIIELSHGDINLDAGPLRTLKKTQALIADAEKRVAAKPAEPPQFATRAELDALRTAYALTLAQLVSCVTNQMYSPGRYMASLDDLCSKQAAAVQKEVARLVREINGVRTVDIAGNRNSSLNKPYQPGYRPF